MAFFTAPHATLYYDIFSQDITESSAEVPSHAAHLRCEQEFTETVMRFFAHPREFVHSHNQTRTDVIAFMEHSENDPR